MQKKWWGCAAGRWKLDPKRSREKWNLGPKRSNSVRIGSFNTPKDRFGVGGWEKIPQKDRARSCQSEKRGSKPRHICITHHIGSTPPGYRPISQIPPCTCPIFHAAPPCNKKCPHWLVLALWCSWRSRSNMERRITGPEVGSHVDRNSASRYRWGKYELILLLWNSNLCEYDRAHA